MKFLDTEEAMKNDLGKNRCYLDELVVMLMTDLVNKDLLNRY